MYCRSKSRPNLSGVKWNIPLSLNQSPDLKMKEQLQKTKVKSLTAICRYSFLLTSGLQMLLIQIFKTTLAVGKSKISCLSLFYSVKIHWPLLQMNYFNVCDGSQVSA